MDDKKFIRNLKKQVKKTGNRKLRKLCKDVEANPDDFDYGWEKSANMNGRDGKNRKKK